MKRTILLADDSPTIQRLVMQTFADAKFEVVSVSNGEAAIKKFDELKPAIVLADIYMPGKNGYEVCAYIKNHPSLAVTPVVLLVGAFDAFDQESANRVGASSNITKPFEPHALVELVESLVRSAAAEPNQAPAESSHDQKVEKFEAAGAPAPGPEAEPLAPESTDLLGLESIFSDVQAAGDTITDEYIDRIAERVVQKLSTQVIENIAWDIVPDITEKIIREELKKIDPRTAASNKHES
jgi:CheY-like chemotaxis protein